MHLICICICFCGMAETQNHEISTLPKHAKSKKRKTLNFQCILENILRGNYFLRQHFTSLKGQPTAGVAIFVKKCVFLQIPDFHCVCLYVDDLLCMCVAKPPLAFEHVFMCFCDYWSVCGQAFV